MVSVHVSCDVVSVSCGEAHMSCDVVSVHVCGVCTCTCVGFVCMCREPYIAIRDRLIFMHMPTSSYIAIVSCSTVVLLPDSHW